MTEGDQVRLWGWGTVWYVAILIFCVAAWYGAWMVVGKAAFGQELQSPPPSLCLDSDKPCGDGSFPLQQAYEYCRQYFWKPTDIIESTDSSSRCAKSKPGVGGYTWVDCIEAGYYTLPACDEVAKRWGVSSQKKAADETTEKLRQAEIAHAKAFVEVVRKGLK